MLHRRVSGIGLLTRRRLVDLSTTNLLLGIMAAVSLLEALAVVGLIVGGVLVYRRLAAMLARIEERQIAPAISRVNAILDDVKDVTGTVKKVAGDVGDSAKRGWAVLDWIRRRGRAA
jgi:hypothetical protein